MTSYSTMVHEYFDRSLNGAHEDVLFAELGRNPELRREFTEHMMLRTAVHTDISSIRTPVDSTNHIFTTLGFALPIAEEVVRPAGFFSQFFSKYASGITTALVSSFATALIFAGYNTMSSEKAPQPKFAAAEPQPLVVELKVPAAQAGAPASEQSARRETRASKIFNTENAISFARNTNPVQQLENDESIPALRDDVAAANYTAPSLEKQDLPRAANNNASRLSSFRGFDIVSLLNDPNISVNFRSNYLVSAPNVAVGTSSPNYNLELMYKLNENVSVGILFGKESFGQEFRIRRGDRDLTYRQTPSLLLVGGAASLVMPEFSFFNMTPYSSLAFGWAETGAFGKGILGLRLPLSESFGLNAGIEGSGLRYQAQGKTFWSANYGVNAGINFNF